MAIGIKARLFVGGLFYWEQKFMKEDRPNRRSDEENDVQETQYAFVLLGMAPFLKCQRGDD